MWTRGWVASLMCGPGGGCRLTSPSPIHTHAIVTRLPLHAFRNSISSLREQASTTPPPTYVDVAYSLVTGRSTQQQPGTHNSSSGKGSAHSSPSSAAASTAPLISTPIPPRVHLPEEEIAFGPACWLWDYLR